MREIMDLIKDLNTMLFNNKYSGENIDLYDYIASNYYLLSKDELKEIILNLIYSINSNLEDKYNGDILAEKIYIKSINEFIERNEE